MGADTAGGWWVSSWLCAVATDRRLPSAVRRIELRSVFQRAGVVDLHPTVARGGGATAGCVHSVEQP